MQIEFKTVVENDVVSVLYIRDGIEISKQETTAPLTYIAAMLTRIKSEPHMIFEIHITIIGADLSLSEN